MIEKQPEALRLADALDTDRAWLAKRQLHQQSMSDASAVLRTQHAAIAELVEALKSADVLFGDAGYHHDGPTRRLLLTLFAKHRA